jgi:endonuclease YncB( thermonuclease family)
MKKILSIILLLVFTLGSTFAYNPTKKDLTTITTFNTVLDNLYKNNPEKVYNFHNQVNILLPRIKNDDRTKYVLTEVNNYLNQKFNIVEEIINEYEVLSIIDWDTIRINYNWESKSVRLIWIDAPENSTTRLWYVEKLWEESKQKLTELIWDNKVIIEFDESQWKYDIYNRLLWYVFLNWVNINQKMIELWLANEYTFNKPYKYQKEFLEVQKIAIESELWIWSGYKEKIKNYKFYTSSHHTAKLYYCETDSAWKNLSEKYLREYDSEEELLNDSINKGKTLSKECSY